MFDAANGEPLEIAPILLNIVGNVIYGIVFGTRFDHDDPKFETVTAKLISAFVFAIQIVQLLFYLNPKFQDSSSFLC